MFHHSGHPKALQKKLSRFTALPLSATSSGFLEGHLHMTKPTPLVFLVAQQAKIPTKTGIAGIVCPYLQSTFPIPSKLLLGTEKKNLHHGEDKRSITWNVYHLPPTEGKRSPEVHNPYLSQGWIQAGMSSWCSSKPSPIHIEITTQNKPEPSKGFPALPGPCGVWCCGCWLRKCPLSSHQHKEVSTWHSQHKPGPANKHGLTCFGPGTPTHS